MKYSSFGKRFAGDIGIGELMDDLGEAMVADPAPLMLGGGNPAHIPEVQAIFRKRIESILSQPGEFESTIGNYDTPQGAKNFVGALSDLFRSEFGWDVGPENFALTNGSQNAFFPFLIYLRVNLKVVSPNRYFCLWLLNILDIPRWVWSRIFFRPIVQK